MKTTKPADHKMLVLPSRNLIRLLERAIRARRVPYNYLAAWKDTRGWGVSLSRVEWLPEGQTYINPESRR